MKRSIVRRILVYVILVFFTAGLVYLTQPAVLYYVWQLLQSGDIAGLAYFLGSFGLQGVLVTMLLFIVVTFTMVFPFFILAGASGIVFGLFWGTVISWMGEVAGAIILFAAARFICRPAVERWAKRNHYLQEVERFSRHDGFRKLFFARLIPVIPSGVLSAAAAISPLPFREFFWATFLGKLPPAAFKVLIGHDLADPTGNQTRLLAAVCFLTIVYSCCLFFRYRAAK